MIRIENEFVSIGFCEKTGMLASLYCKAAKKEFITVPSFPFEIFSDFKEPYRFKRWDITYPPTEFARKVYEAKEFHLSSDNGGHKLIWKDENGIQAELFLSLKKEEITLNFKITNTGSEDAALMPMFPYFGSLNLKAPEAKMLVMNNAGMVDDMWAVKGGPYGNAHYHSAQFGCFFEGDACMGYLIKDERFGAKEFRYENPAFGVSYFPEKLLKKGESILLPETTFLIYGGNWRRTALAYGEWYRENANPTVTPKWIRELDSYTGAWAEKKGNPNQDKPNNLSLPMETFEDLWERYVEFPIDIFEYAFYCEGSSRPGLFGKNLHSTGGKPHTDGWNVPRADLGGTEALRRGVEKLHQMGRRITLYIEGLIVPQKSELFRNIPDAINWLIHNPDGSNDGPYTESDFYHMCPGSEKWQDHVADMAARLVRETNVDGIRLDSYSFYFWPCYNEAHHHESPFDYNKWMMQMLEKVSKAVKAVKPDILLSTESPVDFNHKYFNHSLNQYFVTEGLYKLTNDTQPLRVAMPDYPVMQWNGGAVAQVLGLMPDGYGRPYGADEEDVARSENLQAFRAAVRNTWCYGDASLPNPRVSGTGTDARLLHGEKEDIVFLARPARGKEYIESYEKLIIPVLEPEEVTVSLPLAYCPEEVYYYGLSQKEIRPLAYCYDGATLSVTVKTNLGALVIRKEKGEALVVLEMAEAAKANETVTINAVAPALSGGEKVKAKLAINGLAGYEAVEVMVPGRFCVTLPEEMHKGRYIFTVTGEGIRPAVGILKVDR